MGVFKRTAPPLIHRRMAFNHHRRALVPSTVYVKTRCAIQCLLVMLSKNLNVSLWIIAINGRFALPYCGRVRSMAASPSGIRSPCARDVSVVRPRRCVHHLGARDSEPYACLYRKYRRSGKFVCFTETVQSPRR